MFPGILGRVCDRPCEPACRRGRIEQKPVAICRLKRVAADHRDDVSGRLPKIPKVKNGKRVALIGAGCASLTVANDLMPLGYEVTIFEQYGEPGGLMRTNIPSFRLPHTVLNEEIAMITGMGVDLRLNTPVKSMRALLGKGGFDAVFVGSGAPKGKELNLPGREAGAPTSTSASPGSSRWPSATSRRSASGCSSSASAIPPWTAAAPACGSAPQSVKVMARKPRGFFKASEWELEDAEEESVQIVVNRSPKSFVIENGQLAGMLFDQMEYELEAHGRITRRARRRGGVPARRRRHPRHRPGERLPVGGARPRHRVRQVGRAAGRQGHLPVHARGGVLRRRRRLRARRTSSGRSSTATRPPSPSTATARARPVGERLAPGMSLASRKMGMHEWSYANDYTPVERRLMPHVSLKERFKKLNIEVELGFTAAQAEQEVQRCLNCDVQTVFTAKLCIECDACIDICPVDCLTITHNGAEAQLRARLKAPARNLAQPLYVSAGLPQTARVMVKDEDLCVHCGLCAERCPTAAWDMQKSELHWPHAGDEAVAIEAQKPKIA